MNESHLFLSDEDWVLTGLKAYAGLRGTPLHELDDFASLIYSGNGHEALGEIVEVMVEEGLSFDRKTLEYLDSKVPIYPDNDWDADIRDAVDYMLGRKALGEIFQE